MSTTLVPPLPTVTAPTPPPASRLGRLVHRTRWLVIGLAVVLLAVGGLWGTQVFGRLSGGGFDTPGSESALAADRVEAAFGRQEADVAVVYSSDTLTVEAPAFQDAVEDTLAALPEGEVTSVTSYWSSGGAPTLVADEGRSTLVLLQLDGASEDARAEAYDTIADDLAAPGLVTYRGGQAAVFHDVNEQVEADLARAEALSLPVVLVLLTIVFGSLAAASLPLAVGGIAILGAFTVLNLLTRITDVSVYSVNIVTMLGLGLAIDYALFVVSRFREEMRELGGTRAVVPAALGRTMATAGRTVLFSGVTVAVSLSALLLFPQGFLRSMGYGGVAAVAVAMIAALTVLPALLAVLGPRVDALRVRRRRGTRPQGEGAWTAIARAVMRRPGLVAGSIAALLLVLGLPFLQIAFGGVDARVLPEDAESRIASEVVDRDFVAAGDSPVEVVVTGADEPALASYVSQLAELPSATGAQVVAIEGDTALVDVSYSGAVLGETGRDLVGEVREVPAPKGVHVLVGGQAAALEDLLSSLGDVLPWAIGFVVAVTLVLLFLAFGSVVLPVKAVVMNALSLSAMFGVIVWIFQQGNLASWFGVTPTGTIEATQPVLMVAIAFGLSMDYEVFLLSRIREEWDRTHDNTLAVAAGLQRTGRIITSAALLLVVVIAAFATSGISFITMIGVGLAVAIVLDATVVRALLVPATMRLLGRANWWAPAPLARWWERYGLRHT